MRKLTLDEQQIVARYLELKAELFPLEREETELKEILRGFGPGKYEGEKGSITVAKKADTKLPYEEPTLNLAHWRLLTPEEQWAHQRSGLVGITRVIPRAPSAPAVTARFNPHD